MHSQRLMFMPIVVFIFGLSLTLLFLFQYKEYRDLQNEVRVNILAQSISARLEEHVGARLDVAQALARRWSANGPVTVDMFEIEADSIHTYFPDFQAINWVDSDRVTRWVTPQEGNEAAVGLDLNDLRVPRDALDIADQTSQVSLTPPIELAQGGLGIVAYIPLSRGTNREGYVGVVFRITPLFLAVVRDSIPDGYKVFVRDGEVLVYESDTGVSSEDTVFSVENDASIGNRTWSFLLTGPRPKGIGSIEAVILCVGLLLTAVIAYLSWKLVLAQHAYLSSVERFRDFANVSSDWFWETNSDHQFVFVSEGHQRITGISSEALQGKSEGGSIATSGEKAPWAIALAAMETRKPFQELRHDQDGADGSRIHVSISAVPIFERSGVFLGYRGTGRDITSYVEAEAKLSLALIEAENANATKSAFIATMSHELRTPLNAIIGFGEVLRDGHLGKRSSLKSKEYLGHICDSGKYLLNLINDILILSQSQGGERGLEIECVDLKKLIHEAVTRVRLDARKKSVEITIRIDPESDKVDADYRGLMQVLLNLLSNAIRFTPQAGQITITAAPMRHGVAIGVKDTGTGIPEHLLSKVTQPFFSHSDDGAGRFDQRGTGLGLSIVARLIDLHGGTLTINSQYGNGTEVICVLPASGAISNQIIPEMSGGSAAVEHAVNQC